MRIHVFSAKPHDISSFDAANVARHDLHYLPAHLTPKTAALAEGADAVCVFVNDHLDAAVIEALASHGVRLIVLRCAGFNNVDLTAAAAAGIAVGRVPAYSPHAVAEHALALILTLNRKTHRAWARVREGNFDLHGLMGFDLYGKTVGVLGAGQIGATFARIMLGLGCTVLACDPAPNQETVGPDVTFVPLAELLARSDIVSINCLLTPETHHLIDDAAVEAMKPGAMLINTSRGGVIDTPAVIRGLKSGKIGALGMDVYEEESDLFFEDLSDTIIADDVFTRLLTFPNVLITGHQGFFTHEATHAIAETTLANATAFERDGAPVHPVTAPG